MAVQLNHLIMPSRDKERSAEFLTGILGLDPPKPFAHFLCVEVGNGVTLGNNMEVLTKPFTGDEHADQP